MSKPLDAVGTTGSKISLSDESPAVRNDALTTRKQLEQNIAELKAWKKEANAVLTATAAALDEAMDEPDKARYLGRSPAWILTDIFKRAHEAEQRIRHDEGSR